MKEGKRIYQSFKVVKHKKHLSVNKVIQNFPINEEFPPVLITSNKLKTAIENIADNKTFRVDIKYL